MKLDYISFEILKLIALYSGISINNLCSKLNISRRNFYYRLGVMNDWLLKQGCQPIQNSRSKGLSLLAERKQDILSLLMRIDVPDYELSRNERIAQIIILLAISARVILLEDINQLNHVSRNTTLADIALLNQYHNGIVKFSKKRGYFLANSPLQQRLLVLQVIQTMLKNKRNFIEKLILKAWNEATQEQSSMIKAEIEQEILFAEQHLKRKFTDKDHRLLHYLLMISYLHVFQNQELLQFNEQQRHYLTQQLEWNTAQVMRERLLNARGYQWPDSETLFISLLLLITKTYRTQYVYSQDDKILINAIQQLITEFECLAGIYFVEKVALGKQLFIHLKPAIQRELFNIHIENSLRGDIQQNYPKIVNITRRAIKVIERVYKFEFNEDELAYIAISFAAWMNKSEKTEEKKLLLITEGGISSTVLLEQQLRKLVVLPLSIYSKSMTEYLSIHPTYDFDLIITTAHLPVVLPPSVPVVKVNHILDERDQLLIRNIIEERSDGMKIVSLVNVLLDEVREYIPPKQQSMIRDKFNRCVQASMLSNSLLATDRLTLFESLTGHIQIHRRKLTWRDAVILAGQPLLEKKIIEQDYLQEIIDNISTCRTSIYLTPQVVLLHAAPLRSQRKPYLSLLKLTNPVLFSAVRQQAEVVLIFLLVPEKTNQHFGLLEELSAVLSDDVRFEQLLSAKTEANIIAVFSK